MVAIGRVYADLVFTGLDGTPQPGHEVFARRLDIVPGGGPFITASYAAALGLRAALWGVAPAAPFEACVMAGVSRNRIIGLLESPPPGTEPQITAALVQGGDRAFVTRRTGPLLPQGALPEARHLHIGEMTSALEAPGLIATARQRGMTVSLDCGWDAAMFADPRLAETVASVDLFLPNDEEIAALHGAGVALRPRQALVIKRGAGGARAILTASGEELSAPARETTVLDTTGAGDAFNAGFLAGWLGGRDPLACLELGNACGALAVARIGGAEGLGDLRGLVEGGTASAEAGQIR
nr:carbohydrate kinase family protein [Frigidibacter sp. ROC022]